MKTICKRLHRGDDLLRAVCDLVKEHNISAGVVLSAVGCIKAASFISRVLAEMQLFSAAPGKRYQQHCRKNQYCSKSFHDFSLFLIIKKQKPPFCTEAVKALIFGRVAKE